MKSTLGQRIKEIRVNNGMTTESFAKAIGMSQPGLAHIENDRTSPRANNIISIIERFNIDAQWLLTGKMQGEIKSSTAIQIGKIADKLTEESRRMYLRIMEKEALIESILSEQEKMKKASSE